MGSDPKIRRILCQRLLQLRHENNLTQAELSSLSAIPQPVLSLYENQGSSRSPTLYALVRLANSLNVSTDYLLGRTDDKSGARNLISEDSVISQLSRRDRQVLLRVAEGLHAASVQKQEAMKSSRTQKIVPPADVKTLDKRRALLRPDAVLVREISAAGHPRNFTRKRAGFYILRSRRMDVVGHSEIAFLIFRAVFIERAGVF